MSYNNTSCFNARKVAKTDSWSKHAYGMAIDINPLYNPYVGEMERYSLYREKYMLTEIKSLK